MPLTPFSRLGPYVILAPLGAGGMGEVYRARDTRLDRDVAVKVLPPHLGASPDALVRFEREAKAVAALSHPNILALHDFGTAEGTTYAVMELLEGETLRDRLKSGPLRVRRAVEIASQIAGGIAAAHEKGIVHRDLKPENLFLTKDGQVKILDFGLVRHVAPGPLHKAGDATLSRHTDPGTVLGTATYLSPEQAKGLPADARSDIFSFGAVLYEMLAGCPAFRRDSFAETLAAILNEEPPDPPGAPTGLARVVGHCLEKRPDERFQSARDMAFALAGLSDSGGRAAVPLGQEPAVPAGTSRVDAWNAEEVAQIQTCLAKVLSSPVFSQAERQKKFLRYLVTQTLAGRADALKGYTIGIEVFDRGASFDPTVDAIVRVEAGRLRSKLREYYDGEGRGDPIRIEIPKGSYSIRISAAEPRSSGLGPGALEPTREAALVPGLAPETDDRPSLAVLPFANMSGEVEQDYFADGITDDLTTELSKLSRLLVISRHSAFVYKGVARKAQEIAKELGVRYLLEGSVRRAGERVRIAAQLTDSASGAHVWAERYDRDIQDIFAVQDDVTRRIVETLQVKLSPTESDDLGHEGTASIEAHDMLLRGMERHWLYSRESIAEAQRFFTRAVELDPEYAAAHAWLARSYAFQWTMNWTPDELLERAYEHAKTAVRLDDRLPYSHSVLGWVQMWRKQGEEAILSGRRAVSLDSNNADAQFFFSMALTSLGRGKEGLSYIRNAMRLNPHPSVIYLWGLGMSYLVLGQYEESIVAFRRGIELRDAFIPNHAFLAIVYAVLGREPEMAAARDKALALAGGRKPPVAKFWLDPKLRDWQARYWKLAGLL